MGPRSHKKLRRGGGGGDADASRAYSALIPEDEWEYIVTALAEAFGQEWWDVYDCKPHGQPHLTWYAYYRLAEKQRIDELRRELDALDSAIMTAHAVNQPEGLDKRRADLQARLRFDPSVPAKPRPKWTHAEMMAAAQRLVDRTINAKVVKDLS